MTGLVDLAETVAQQLDTLDAKTSLYAKHLASQEELAVRADEAVNPLSTIKLPVMVLAYRDAAAGLLDFGASLRWPRRRSWHRRPCSI